MSLNQKIFDIIPPEKEKGKGIEIKKERVEVKKRWKIKKLKKTPLLVSVGLVFLLGAAGYFFLEPRAELDIWPEKEKVDFKIRDEKPSLEVIKVQKPASREFPASGRATKAQKAEGVIKIFNKYQQEQVLIAKTRFWCFLGEELREFQLKEGVRIPAQSFLDVQVVAAEAGEKYNIEPCTFSVPGLRGSSRYTLVYGESYQPMTGGLIEDSAQVTQEDIDLAEKLLSEEALKASSEALQLDILPEYIWLDGASLQQVIKFTAGAEAGALANTFQAQAEAESKALVFKKSGLELSAQNHIISQISSDKALDAKTLKVEYSPSTINPKAEQIVLDLLITAELYFKTDEVALKDKIRGKSSQEISVVIQDFPRIQRAQVRLWPFWVTKAPLDSERIKINLRLDGVD